MKILYMLMLGCLCCYTGSSQNIEEIDYIVNHTEALLQDSLLYSANVQFNTLIAGLGDESLHLRFDYEIEPANEEHDNTLYRLKKVHLSYWIAASESHELSYYFNDKEKLIYCYEKVEVYTCGERELYFKKDACILFVSRPGTTNCIDSELSIIYPNISTSIDFNPVELKIINNTLLEAASLKSQYMAMQSIAQKLLK